MEDDNNNREDLVGTALVDITGQIREAADMSIQLSSCHLEYN